MPTPPSPLPNAEGGCAIMDASSTKGSSMPGQDSKNNAKSSAMQRAKEQIRKSRSRDKSEPQDKGEKKAPEKR